MAKETPSVWLLLPSYPATAEEEQSNLEEQWREHQPWWRRWLWWWFCWRHKTHFKRLEKQAHNSKFSIQELNRLLGGDAKCSLYTLQSDSLNQTVRHLPPKSVVHLFPIGLFPSRWEEILLDRLLKTLTEGGHSVQFINRPTTTESWIDIVSQWVRYNLITHTVETPIQHVVLLMRRQLEHWNGFDSAADKKRYLLEQELSNLFPTCTVQILLNAPQSKKFLDEIPETEQVFYGFLDSFDDNQDTLHPALTHTNLHPLKQHPENILLLRILRQSIWDSTGCAP